MPLATAFLPGLMTFQSAAIFLSFASAMSLVVAAGASLPVPRPLAAAAPPVGEKPPSLALGDGCYLYIEELQKRMMIQYSRM